MSFRKQVLLLLMTGGPKTMAEISESLGVELSRVRDNVHPMASEKLFDRQAGENGVIEYRISRKGREYCQRIYAEAMPDERPAADALAVVIGEKQPAPDDESQQTAQTEACATVVEQVPMSVSQGISLDFPEDQSEAYFLRDPSTGLLRPTSGWICDESTAVEMAKNLAEETELDVQVYRLARIGTARHCVVFEEL